jgi:hypothetical protein
MADPGVAGHVADRFTSSIISIISMSPCSPPPLLSLSTSPSPTLSHVHSLAQSLTCPNTAAKGKLIQMMIQQQQAHQQGGQASSAASLSMPLLLPPDAPLIPCSYNDNIIVTLNANDVLAGRGSKISHHSGNIAFRHFVSSFKLMYMDISNKLLFKAHMCAHIVDHVRTLDLVQDSPTGQPPGDFYKSLAQMYGLKWGDENARKKAEQALREDATVIRAMSWGWITSHYER